MDLLAGPAGSGKNLLVLEGLREALRRKDSRVRLLVPTATLARHLQNRIAREGFVLRPGLIQTLSRFVEPWVADLPQVSEARLYLMVEDAVRRLARPEFASVAPLAGFCASLARTVEEFSSAGCDACRLAGRINGGTFRLSPGFVAVYEEVERELARRGMAMRATRLLRAAERIREQGAGGVRTFWLDGFQTLTDPELEVIEALRSHAEVTVTEPSDELRAAVELVEAPSIEREADEIARRILEEAAGGRPFREMGIIVRNTEAYEPVLRATLERFGIPARFYLDAPLAEHAVTRFLAGAVDALLGGWEHAATLAVLRLDPAAGNSDAMDHLDFEVRERLPGQGLGLLKELAEDTRIRGLVEKLEALESWRGQSLAPAGWAARAGELRGLFQPPRPPEDPARGMVEIWRSQAAVLRSFDRAVEEAAASFADARPLKLAEFWRAVKAVLRLSPLRLEDERRNIVHVLSAPEARQWELPVVFVCGLVEKQFPRYAPPNPFFPDAARRGLQAAGIRVRTAADAEQEEEFLFHSAVTRATSRLTLSYPKCDARGEQNLPSLFLERFGLAPQAAQPVRPEPQRKGAETVSARIHAPDLLEVLAAKHRAMTVTALESYVQCPFQFFSRYTLELKEPPARPEDRLDARVQGGIVHRAISEWLRTREPLPALFARIFAEECEKQRVPAGYRTAALRQQMLGDLERFVADPQWPSGFETSTEQPFEFDGLRGRIDRLERAPEARAYIIEYKYSKKAPDYAKDPLRLQGPLYVLAAEKALGLKPAGMFYCGLRGAVKYAGWSDGSVRLKSQPIEPKWLEAAAATARRAADEVRAGNVAPRPASADPCRYCPFRDACRFTAPAAAEAAEGA